MGRWRGMADRLKTHCGAFLVATWRHWEACFGTTFAVILALAQYLVLEFSDPRRVPKWVKDFPPSLWLAIGVVLFLWASYLAWREERHRSTSAEERFADRTPRIALRVTSAHGNGLTELENCIPPPVFNLLHVSGDGARFVDVGPIISPSGRQLVFETVNVVAPPVQVSLPFIVRMRGGEKGPRRDDWEHKVTALIHFFLADNPDQASERTYEVPIVFPWNGGECRSSSCHIRYNYEERKFTVLP